MKVHYTAPYLLNPSHKVSVNVIGAGGTGSQVIQALARMNEALTALGHPGLHVTLFDDDTVSESNKGRQLYSEHDIGQHKASLIITRINRFLGYNWQSINEKYSSDLTARIKNDAAANITITCVDSAKARIAIGCLLQAIKGGYDEHKQYYWMDFGNDKKIGQVVLGTISKIDQPKSKKYDTVESLPNTLALFDWNKIKTKDTGASCSVAEALNKQDLFINSTLANLGMSLLWQLFREGKITNHGLYLNLETMKTNPINL